MNNVTPPLKMLLKNTAFIFTLGSLALLSSGCSDAEVSGGDVPKPTVDSLPSKTNNPALPISGTRGANTAIWIHYQGADQKLLVEAGDNSKWNGKLDLSEGENKFVIFAAYKGNTSVSPPTDLVAVILDTVPPSPPGVDSPPEVVSIGDDGSSDVS